MSTILFIVDSMQRGGKERQLFELLKGLSASGHHRIHLLVLGDNIEFEGLEAMGVRVHQVVRRTRYCVASYFKIAKVVRDCKPDIVNSWTIMGTFYAFVPAKVRGAKFVDSTIQNTFLEPANPLVRVLRRLMFRCSDNVVSNSIEGLRIWGLEENARNRVVYNGVDLGRFKGVESGDGVRGELGVKTKYLVGMVANFTAYKDYETFFKAAESVLARRQDVSFLAIGDGPSRPTYLKRYEQELGRHFFLPGKISSVERYIEAFDIGVLSTPREGISNAILEYCACGKAVVATGEGGTAEIIDGPGNGRLLPAGRPESLAASILELLDDGDTRAALGKEALRTVREKFSFESMIASYAAIYG